MRGGGARALPPGATAPVVVLTDANPDAASRAFVVCLGWFAAAHSRAAITSTDCVIFSDGIGFLISAITAVDEPTLRRFLQVNNRARVPEQAVAAARRHGG